MVSTIKQTALSPFVSRYGDHVVEWDDATLDEVFTQLRQERQQIADIDTAKLLAEAVHIKNNANQILKADASPVRLSHTPLSINNLRRLP
jgi:hypothetical protein